MLVYYLSWTKAAFPDLIMYQSYGTQPDVFEFRDGSVSHCEKDLSFSR